MADAYPVLTGETGTVNTGTNVVTLDDTTPVRDLRLFSAAVTAGSLVDGQTVRVLVKESATKQAAWIATYDATAKTLTRTTLIDAIGTLTNSAAVDVTVEPLDPFQLLTLSRSLLGHVELQQEPFSISGTSTVTATVEGPSKVMVNGKLLTESADVSSSGTGVSGTDLYYCYVANDGSDGMTLTVENVDPVWDDDHQYWKHGSAGVSKRMLFPIIVISGSAAVTPDSGPKYVKTGPRSVGVIGLHEALVNSTGDDSTAWNQVSLVNWVPPSVFEMYIGFSVDPNAAGTAGVGFSDRDQSTDVWAFGQFYGRAYSESAADGFVNTSTLYLTGQNLYYRTDASDADTVVVIKRFTYLL